MRKKPPRFRGKLLINYRIQMKIIGYAIFFSVITSVLTALFTKSIYQSPAALEIWVFLGGLALLVAILVGGFVLTNHICGPLYRFQRHIKAMEEGQQLPPLQIRKGDEFAELVETFNRLIASMGE